MSSPSNPFDVVASRYDETFTRTSIGRLMRQATWHRFAQCFEPGHHVLELNCGTGEDAVHLAVTGVHVLATDASAEMVAQSERKIAEAGVAALVTVRQLDIDQLGSLDPGLIPTGGFDGVISNFGGLNCVADLSATAAAVAAVVKPGARVVFCVMGPLVPWEWIWFLSRGKVAKAFRRFRRGGTEWRGLRVRYPSIHTVKKAFSPWFVVRRTGALGTLLPPPYANAWADRRPQMLERLNRWERRLETVFPLPWLADHYVIEMTPLPRMREE